MYDIFGRACAFETSIDGERFVAAGSAEGVAGIPIQKMASFCVDGRYI